MTDGQTRFALPELGAEAGRFRRIHPGQQLQLRPGARQLARFGSLRPAPSADGRFASRAVGGAPSTARSAIHRCTSRSRSSLQSRRAQPLFHLWRSSSVTRRSRESAPGERPAGREADDQGSRPAANASGVAGPHATEDLPRQALSRRPWIGLAPRGRPCRSSDEALGRRDTAEPGSPWRSTSARSSRGRRRSSGPVSRGGRRVELPDATQGLHRRSPRRRAWRRSTARTRREAETVGRRTVTSTFSPAAPCSGEHVHRRGRRGSRWPRAWTRPRPRGRGPKSMRKTLPLLPARGRPSSFSGFRSRWITPCSWAYCRPARRVDDSVGPKRRRSCRGEFMEVLPVDELHHDM